jgi:hypothetical protein
MIERLDVVGLLQVTEAAVTQHALAFLIVAIAAGDGERSRPRLRRVVQDELVRFLVHLFERALEDEVWVTVVLRNPGRDDVGLEKLCDLFKDFRRDLRDIEFVNQGPGNLIERGLSLKGEPL